MRYVTLLSAAVFLSLAGCNEQGLDPNDVTEPGFRGTISFISKRPPADSLKDLRIVAVPYFPIDTLFLPIILKVVEGTIPFGENITSKADSGTYHSYEMLVKPQVYHYIAVVQQFGPDVFSHWKVVGVHSFEQAPFLPKPVAVKDGVMSTGVDITVDFYNLPPQPFRVP